MAGPYILKLLGGVSLAGPDGPLEGRVVQHRRLALLALLASARDHPVSRDKLIATLWPESPAESARHSLSDALHVLNKALGKRTIVAAGDELRLDPTVVASDVAAFEEAIEGSDFENAVDLYGGPFLDGFFVSGALEFDNWAAAERERLARIYGEALERLAKEASERGDPRAAAGWWARRSALDPYDGRVAVHLMEALAAAGDRGGAIQHAGAHAALLRRELDAEPDPMVTDLACRLRQEPGPWSPPADVSVPPGGKPAKLDLRGIARAVRRGELPHLTWGRAIAGGVIAFAILLGAAGLYVVIQDGGRSFAPDEALADAGPGIAVLPFSLQGAGLDVWREGAIDLIGANLDGAAGLRAIDSRTLLARWRETVRDGEEPDLTVSLKVARRTGARYALVGSAVALGRDLRLTANIYDLAGGKSLGQAQVQGSPDSVYMLVDQLSIEALQAILGEKAGDLPRVELARVTTASLPALKAYLEGEILFRKADFAGAQAAYQEAVEADSTFALAWRRVAESRGWSRAEGRPPGWGAAMREAAQEAARWSGRLPERESVLVLAYRAYVFESMTMLEPLKAAVNRYPDDPELFNLLAEYYAHYGDPLLVDPAETEHVIRRTLELDPTFAPPYEHAIEYAFYYADSARALDLISMFERLVGDTRQARNYRLAATLAWGPPSERSTALAILETLPAREIPNCFWFAAPRLADLQLACARATLENGGDARWLFYASLGTGKIEMYHEARRAGGRGFPALFEVATLLYLRQRDLPVDGDRLRDAAASHDTYPTSFFAAVLAAEDGRTDGVRAFQEIAGALRDSMLAEGDSLRGARIEGHLRMIEGYVALQHGERERALALLVEGQRKQFFPFANNMARWTIAELLVDLGRPEEAIPYYRSFRFDPFAFVELGKIYQGLGRVDQAKEQYETALAHWREADPVLAPRVAEVRQRLAGLGPQPRG
jgi:DNA-binding SARP family transcriptional activator/TolB-like protein